MGVGGVKKRAGEEEWGGKSLGGRHCGRRMRSRVVTADSIAPFLPDYVVMAPALPCLFIYLDQKSIVLISVRVTK